MLYDQPSNTLGVYRARFILKAYGFSNVRILEGGLAKWFSKNLEVEPGKGDPAEPIDLPLLTCDCSRLVQIDEIKDILRNKSDYLFVDGRAKADYEGNSTANIAGCR